MPKSSNQSRPRPRFSRHFEDEDENGNEDEQRLAARPLRVFTGGALKSDSSTEKSPQGLESKPVIFVVDDEPLLLELASALLSDLTCEVKTFRDGESALKGFSTSNPRPALIITDYAMHRMDGMKLIQECRRIEPAQKIILTSGTVDQEIYRHSNVKPDHFLPKPYQIKEFIDAVQSVLAS